jgi:hypothetical protein
MEGGKININYTLSNYIRNRKIYINHTFTYIFRVPQSKYLRFGKFLNIFSLDSYTHHLTQVTCGNMHLRYSLMLSSVIVRHSLVSYIMLIINQYQILVNN